MGMHNDAGILNSNRELSYQTKYPLILFSNHVSLYLTKLAKNLKTSLKKKKKKKLQRDALAALFIIVKT